jgi:hypothetical protein
MDEIERKGWNWLKINKTKSPKTNLKTMARLENLFNKWNLVGTNRMILWGALLCTKKKSTWSNDWIKTYAFFWSKN